MKSFFIFFTSVALGMPKQTHNSKFTIIPEIRYEFSGGAGHYNYAPSVIQDEYTDQIRIYL